MALFLDVNSQYFLKIVQDIQIICGDPYASLDYTTGRYTTPAHGGDAPPGCLLLATIAGSNYNVRIRAEGPQFSIAPDTGSTLAEVHGYTWTSARAPLASSNIEIVYDATDCDGKGYWVVGAQQSGGGYISMPTHVVLVHELVHALRAGEGLDTGNPLDEEQTARDGENLYRASFGLKRRSLVDGLAGCNPPPESPMKKNETSKTTKSWGGFNCFVATAAYGSPLAPEVEFLRRFRDDVLRKTRTGQAFFERFHEYYYQAAPTVAAAMHRDPAIMDAMRTAIVVPTVRYLELAMRFPTAPLTDVPEPWRSFLATCRDELEEWALSFPLPESLEGLSVAAAAEEIGVTLRYRLRTEQSRSAFLDRLAATNQIPLKSCCCSSAAIRARLLEYGLASHEIERVLGVAERTVAARGQGRTADDEVSS